MDSKRAIRQLKALSDDVKTMRLAAEDWKNDFQVLISTILSARTRDEVTIPVAEKLFRKYDNALRLSAAKPGDVKRIIRPVNFYRNKSKNIVNCARMLAKNYKGIVPHDFSRLVELPGVGRKTANVFLAEHGKHALPVDTHVFYISRKLGWAKSSHPHKVEEELKSLFPKRYWNKINSVLVRFGKTHTGRKQKDKILMKIRGIK
jgi:endonuclease-3